MKKFLSILLVVAIVLGCMLSMTACDKKETADEKSSMTLNVGAYPDTVDPALNSAVDGATYIIHTFTGLVGYEQDAEGKLVLAPHCATELPTAVETEDGKVAYTYKLRDGLKWSDGSDLTAADFVYAWNRAASPITAADYGYMFEVVDGYAEMNEMDDEGNLVNPDAKLNVTALFIKPVQKRVQFLFSFRLS